VAYGDQQDSAAAAAVSAAVEEEFVHKCPYPERNRQSETQYQWLRKEIFNTSCNYQSFNITIQYSQCTLSVVWTGI
jgi:hypothetical protein